MNTIHRSINRPYAGMETQAMPPEHDNKPCHWTARSERSHLKLMNSKPNITKPSFKQKSHVRETSKKRIQL